MDEKEMINCDGGKSKSVEFVCRIARGLQEKDVYVSFSEIEDALVSVHSLSKDLGNVTDLKSVLRPALVKTPAASDFFNDAFDKAFQETFKKEKRKVKESDIDL